MKNDKLTDIRALVNDDFSQCPTMDEKSMEEIIGIARMLRNMPDQDPPPDLLGKVLRSVAPKQSRLWPRLYQWFSTPRFVRIVPMKLIPAGTVLFAALFLTLLILPRDQMVLRPEGGDLGKVTVKFTFSYPQAKSVSLIGSFNQWSLIGYQMNPTGEDKVWVIELDLSPGRYRYAYLVDGRVVLPDSNAPFSENDGFGNRNSIILIANGYERKSI